MRELGSIFVPLCEITNIMEEIEVTYTAFGFEETTFTMEISEKMYDKLDKLESDGETLDSDYFSEEMPNIHKKILKAIHRNMEDESLEPDDGMVEMNTSWNATYKEYSEKADHSLMEAIVDDDDIEYTIDL